MKELVDPIHEMVNQSEKVGGDFLIQSPHSGPFELVKVLPLGQQGLELAEFWFDIIWLDVCLYQHLSE